METTANAVFDKISHQKRTNNSKINWHLNGNLTSSRNCAAESALKRKDGTNQDFVVIPKLITADTNWNAQIEAQQITTPPKTITKQQKLKLNRIHKMRKHKTCLI